MTEGEISALAFSVILFTISGAIYMKTIYRKDMAMKAPKKGKKGGKKC